MENLREEQVTSIMRVVSNSVDLLDAYFSFIQSGTQCKYNLRELYFPSLNISIDQNLFIRKNETWRVQK